MRIQQSTLLIGAALASVPLTTLADDIELFAGAPIASSDAPNVLFVIDNAADFSANVPDRRCSISPSGEVITNGTGLFSTALDKSAAAVQQCALYSAIQALPDTTPLNIGVMGFNSTGKMQFNPTSNTFSNSCVGNTGGCLLMPLTSFTGSNKARILEWIRNWTDSGNTGYNIKSNNSANGAAMQESWAYLKGKTGVSGRPYAVRSPSCAKNYIIFIGNAYRNNTVPGDQTNEENSPRLPLVGSSIDFNKRAAPAASEKQKEIITGTFTTQCRNEVATLQTAEGSGVYALNWAKYMREMHDIKTYSIGVLGPTCNPIYAAHLSKLGADDVGGGRFFATTNFAELKVAIETALSQILAVNSAFASVSLPVSVNTQGTYLNQVYVGMFRPASGFLPRWHGNLKQYRMGFHDGTLQLLDAQGTGSPAVSRAGTGFVAECARSYWTPSTADDYWTPYTDVHCVGADPRSNSPDGNIVEKGGQAFKLRGSKTAASISRTIRTCSDATCSSLGNFATTNTAITKSALGNASMTDSERDDLINWARGANNADGAQSRGGFVADTAMRPSAHGDVVHSRPVAINFGTDASPLVVVFYGGNDGILRAINGNRDSGNNIGSVTPGNELWSFMAPEFFPNIVKLRTNDTPIFYKGTTVATTQAKPYGFDGAISAYRASATTAWVYATMRRGGRAIYAFLVDFSTPSAPTFALKWRRGCTGSTCTGVGLLAGGISQDMSDIGQTWSAPRIFKAAGYNTTGTGTEKPILVMGGGYDACEDTDSISGGTASNNSCTATSKGKKIYVLDADTGTVLKTFDTSRGVIGEITPVFDSNGLTLFAYAADLGGHVYRINIESAAPSAWTMTQIASLGCATPATCTANRKFMFAPDVVEESGTYYVLVGSGDREKPLTGYSATTGVQNHFFMLKDKPSEPTWLSSESANCGGTSVICLNSLFGVTSAATPTAAELATKPKGIYLAMRSSEQVVTSAITLFGTVTFSTHMPAVLSPGTCGSNLGTASVYNIRYLDASSANGTGLRYETLAGGGLPPSPVAGRVTLDDGRTVPFVIGASPSSPLETREGTPPTGSASSQPRSRVYWYIQQ